MDRTNKIFVIFILLVTLVVSFELEHMQSQRIRSEAEMIDAKRDMRFPNLTPAVLIVREEISNIPFGIINAVIIGSIIGVAISLKWRRIEFRFEK